MEEFFVRIKGQRFLIKDGPMKPSAIHRIDYKNPHKETDFEILDLQRFFDKRNHQLLSKEFRLNFWTVIYITEGHGHHYVDFQAYAYKAGDLVFVQKDQVHRFAINNQVQGYILHINEPFFYRVEGFEGDIFLDFIDKADGSPVIAFDIGESTTNRILIELIKKEYDKDIQDINVALIASLFQGFIIALRGQDGNRSPVFKSKSYEHFKVFRQLVEEHYESSRQVESYATMMHITTKTINQSTREVVGLSAKRYIINRIILEIKRYLSQGVLMNYEIADRLGFGEAANMTKFFKHYEGISPKGFRASLSREV